MTSWARGYDEGIEGERSRIRAAFKVRCGLNIEAAEHGIVCGLNRGHIGPCSRLALTISITRERFEEILNG